MLGEDEDDDRLIARAAAGDRDAAARVFARHGRAVLSVARALSVDRAAAEDVAQEAFAAALRGLATYRPGASSVRTWLFAITRNAAHSARRRAREVPTDETPLLELGLAAGWGAEAPEEALGRLEDADRLARAVASLTEDEREIVLLRDVERLSGDETSQLLGLSQAAMKSRLHRARLRLMVALRASEGGVMAHQQEVGGLTCGAVLEHLGEYVDGELSAAEVASIQRHLRGCTVCERFGGRYARVVHAARDRLGAAHAVDEATVARVRRALDVEG